MLCLFVQCHNHTKYANAIHFWNVLAPDSSTESETWNESFDKQFSERESRGWWLWHNLFLGSPSRRTGIVSAVTQTSSRYRECINCGSSLLGKNSQCRGVFIPMNMCCTHRKRGQTELNHPFNGIAYLVEQHCKDAYIQQHTAMIQQTKVKKKSHHFIEAWPPKLYSYITYQEVFLSFLASYFLFLS